VVGTGVGVPVVVGFIVGVAVRVGVPVGVGVRISVGREAENHEAHHAAQEDQAQEGGRHHCFEQKTILFFHLFLFFL